MSFGGDVTNEKSIGGLGKDLLKRNETERVRLGLGWFMIIHNFS